MRYFILVPIFLLTPFLSNARNTYSFTWDHVSSTEIKLLWYPGYTVIIVKGEFSEPPTLNNNLEYDVGDEIGSGKIIFNGGGTKVNEFVDSGLSYNNEYHYYLWIVQSWDPVNRYVGPHKITVDFKEDYVHKPYDVTLKATGDDVKITWKKAADQEVVLLRAPNLKHLDIEQGKPYAIGNSIDSDPNEKANHIVYIGDANEFTDKVSMPEHLHYFLWAKPKGSYEYSKYETVDSVTTNNNTPFNVDITPLSSSEIKLTWDVLDNYPVTIIRFGWKMWRNIGLKKWPYKVGEGAIGIEGDSVIYVGKGKELVYSGLHASTGYYFNLWSSPEEYTCYSFPFYDGVTTKPVEFVKELHEDFGPETRKLWGAIWSDALFDFESSENEDPELREYARTYSSYAHDNYPSEIISPTIICDDYDEVRMTFNHTIIKDGNKFTFSVKYSLDEGNTWTTLESWTDENGGFENQTPSYIIPTNGAGKIIFKWDSGKKPSEWRIYSVDIDSYKVLKSDFKPGVTSGCSPLTVDFTNLSKRSDTYLWDFDNGDISTEESPTYTFVDPGTYNVTLEVKNETDTKRKNTIIEVLPSPAAKYKVQPPYLMLPDDTIVFTSNLSSGAVAYEWDFGDGETSESFEPSHIYKEPGNYDFSLLAVADNGCTDTLKNIFEVGFINKIEVPNAFTPSLDGPGDGNVSGAGVNDVFYPITQGVVAYKMQIFNRWDELLFTTDDINVGWDGYYDGVICPADTYVYKMEFKFYNGDEQTKYGEVLLIR